MDYAILPLIFAVILPSHGVFETKQQYTLRRRLLNVIKWKYAVNLHVKNINIQVVSNVLCI